MGIDVGTTGSKVVVFSKSGQVIAHEYQEYSLIHPEQGWMELDAESIWVIIKKLIIKATANVKKDSVKAFSISCQGEAVIPVDKGGNSLYNAIVTFDARTSEQYEFWLNNFGKEKVFEITGMPLHPMYSINKIMWVKKNLPDIFKRANKFLCFEDFIFFKFGLAPTISYCLASRTMAFDVIKKVWSEEILRTAQISSDYFSNPIPSGEVIGEINTKIAKEVGLAGNVVGVAGGHDQGCGAFGSGIIAEGMAINACGTSDVICTIFNKPKLNKKMLENNYPCYPYVMKDKYMTITFNLTGGLLLRWYRDTFCYEEKLMAEKENKSTYKIIDDGIYNKPVNVFILPHFVGSGTPYLDSDSKGLIIGLDLETGKSKLSRAILESNVYDLMFNLEKLQLCGIVVNEIIAIGGGAVSKKWLKIKSDILNKEITTLKNHEAASLGAALLAGLAIGKYSSYKDAVESTIERNKYIKPDKKIYGAYKERYLIYKDLYESNKAILHRISNLR
ncbi:MAG: FGGY family carbohydrate kinase [Actinobacteria bacterium]|nr:FGGY family carbohydrate kinase [Actinomycetota bacterium]